MHIYLHARRLSVRVGLPAAVSALASGRLPALLSGALLLQLLVQESGCVLSQRVARRRRKVLPYAHHLRVSVALRLHDELHGTGRAPAGCPEEFLHQNALRMARVRGGGGGGAGAAGGLVELLHGVVGHWRVVDDVEEAGEAVVDGGVDGAVPSRGGASPCRLAVALLRGGGGGGSAGVG